MHEVEFQLFKWWSKSCHILIKVIWTSCTSDSYDIHRDGIILCKLMEVLRNKPLKGKIIVKSRLNWVTANGNIAQAMNAMKEDGISLVNIGEWNFPYLTKTKQIIHIISFEPITSKASANSFYELSMTSVSIDVIGEFWRATKRELVDIVWIVILWLALLCTFIYLCILFCCWFLLSNWRGRGRGGCVQNRNKKTFQLKTILQ